MGSLGWPRSVKLLAEGFAWGWEREDALAALLTNVLAQPEQHDLSNL